MPMVNQRGISLLEILIGITIGLLVIAIAFMALHTSQLVSAMVRETSALRLDGNNAMRIIGAQIRQAGSTPVNVQPAMPQSTDPESLRPVVFESVLDAQEQTTAATTNIRPILSPVVPRASGSALQVQYENYAERLHPAIWGSQLHDCLGQNRSKHSPASIVTSIFFLRDDQLMCTGVAGIPQPITGNVKIFSARLLVQHSDGRLQYAPVSLLSTDTQSTENIRAVEVCMELKNPTLDTPDVGAHYLQCDGQTRPRGDRMMVIMRQLFHIRIQRS